MILLYKGNIFGGFDLERRSESQILGNTC